MNPLLRAGRVMLDLVLPPRCAGCGEIVAQVGDFCGSCFVAVDWAGDACRGCGLPLETLVDPRCARCLSTPGKLDGLVAATHYDDISRAMVHKLKYGRRVALARVMARAMARKLEDLEADDALLVPVPLHRGRIWKRGYNQAGLLAADLARRTGLDWSADALVRVKATKPLASMSAAQRHSTVRGAFRAERSQVDGRTLVLVDDVRTTGSTLEACAGALKKAGARRVEAVVWSRVVH